MKIKKNYVVLLTLVIIGLFFRFVWLSRFPTGMSHDEIEYSLNGLSYNYLGHDISGYSFPLSIFRTETEGRISPLPALMISLFSHFSPISQFSLRLLYAFLGIASAFFIYKIAGIIFNSKIAIFSGIVFLLNPWSFDLARWVNDASWALLFILIGTYLFLIKSKKYIYLSLVFFLLAFISYQAVKILFLPILSVLFLYKYFVENIKDKKYILFLSLGVLAFFSYVYFEYKLPGNPASGRLNDIVFFDTNGLSFATNTERRITMDNSFKNIFSNKLVSAGKIIYEKYFTAFSPSVLFNSGDFRSTYRFGTHGLFYVLDFFLIIIGIFIALKVKRKAGYLILMFIIISPIATSLSLVETSVFNRSFLLIPYLSILIGLALSYFIDTKLGLFKFILIVIYGFSFISFLNFYFFYFPVAQQENHYLSEEILSIYLKKVGNHNVIVYTNEYRATALTYIFYSEDDRKNAVINFYTNYNKNSPRIRVGNVMFTNNCDFPNDNNISIYHRDSACPRNGKENAITIENQKDSGAIFYIFNDTLCNINDLTTYRRVHRLEDYNPTVMDNNVFCNRWINKV